MPYPRSCPASAARALSWLPAGALLGLSGCVLLKGDERWWPPCDADEVCDGVDNDCDGEVDEDAADAQALYEDQDGDGYGDPAAATSSCDDPSEGGPWTEDGTDCDDGDPGVYPGAAELCGDGVVNDCAAECGVSPGSSCGPAGASLPDVGTLAGPSSERQAGSSVAGAGDIDGDGYPDVVFGAPGYGSSGMIYAVYGGSSDPAAWQVTDFYSPEEDGEWDVYLGFSVAGVGDVDGDGLGDVLAGAPERAVWTGKEYISLPGAAYLLLRDSFGLAVEALVFEGELPGDTLGLSVAAAGDLDGDGASEFLVGAPEQGDPTRPGRAYLLRYDPASPGLSAVRVYEGLAPGSNAGWSVAASGDIDGSGKSYLLIGAPALNDTEQYGAVYLVDPALETDASLEDAAEFAFVGVKRKTQADFAGYAVADAGDVGGDGYDDVLVSAPYNNGGDGDRGTVYLVPGRAELTSLLLGDAQVAQYLGVANSDRVGTSVAGVGDVNGDCYADVLIGAQYATSGGGPNKAGAAYLILGGAEAAAGVHSLADADATYTGVGEEDFAGLAVAGAGDFDADGYGDALVGAPNYEGEAGINAGAAFLILGAGI